MAVQNPTIVTQPHLGKLQEIYKPEDKMGGYLALAKVLTVHYKYNTADVQILRTRDTITSSGENEGRFGARISVSTAHFDQNTMSSSGVVEPIQEGQLVILAFLDGFKSQPIVLGSFHDTWETDRNILTENYPLSADYSTRERREALKYLRVTPSQMYYKIDGIGAVEMCYPSKSFLKIDPDFRDEITDAHSGYDHVHLSELDPMTRLPRQGKTPESKYPLKYLFVHRSSFIEEETTWTKFFLERNGSLRVTRDSNDGKLSYIQLDEQGRYIVRRQNDSSFHNKGNDYTEIGINEKGEYTVLRNRPDGVSSIQITQDGSIMLHREKGNQSVSWGIDADNNAVITNSVGSCIKMMSNGDIKIKSVGNIQID